MMRDNMTVVFCLV